MNAQDQNDKLNGKIFQLTAAVIGAKALLDSLPFNTLDEIKAWATLSRGIVNSLTLLEEFKGKVKP